MSNNVPYDPDLTVGEALDEGLVATYSGVSMRPWVESCQRLNPTQVDVPGFPELRCERVAGHSGPHALMIRWSDLAAMNKAAREFMATREFMDSVSRASRQAQEALDRMAGSMVKVQVDRKRFEGALKRLMVEESLRLRGDRGRRGV